MYSPDSGRFKSRIQVSAELVPSRGSEEKALPCCAPGSLWSLEVLGVLDLPIRHSGPGLSPYGVRLLSVSCPFLIKMLVTGFGVHSNAAGHHFRLHLHRSSF